MLTLFWNEPIHEPAEWVERFDQVENVGMDSKVVGRKSTEPMERSLEYMCGGPSTSKDQDEIEDVVAVRAPVQRRLSW